MLPNLANQKACTACLACLHSCKHDAIVSYIANDGHEYVRIVADNRIGCLNCQRTCETSRIMYGCNDIGLSRIFAAWSLNEASRLCATSGGVFGALAQKVINDGGCVISARVKGFECEHVAITELSKIKTLQGSKYMASSMKNVYQYINEELPRRDVLFVGLGCQCAGVLAAFSNTPTNHNLYTVDLVCGGSPSRILIDKYRQENPKVNGFISFRNKSEYKLTVLEDGIPKDVEEKSLPLHGFNCGLTNRFCCYSCVYAKSKRLTDITIGDLWNHSLYPAEANYGISVAIVHSDIGYTLFKSSEIHSEPIKWSDALITNRRIVCGKQHIYLPRRYLEIFAKTMSAERFAKLYTMTAGPLDIDLFIFRVYRFVLERVRKLLDYLTIEKLLMSRTAK